MSTESLSDRVARELVLVDCPICRHRERMDATAGHCGQCGSEIALFDDLPTAEEALRELVDEDRAAYLRKAASGVYAVIANRSFPRQSET